MKIEVLNDIEVILTPYQLQEEYCKKHKVPLFAPKQCQHKNKWHSAPDLPNDFNELFSIEEASMGLITGCKCGKSWCD